MYTFQRDTQCGSTDCLLMFRCQLYMFRTVTVHPQELLFRCCVFILWHVVRNALSDTSRWYKVLPQTLYQRDVSDSAFLTTYHICTYSIYKEAPEDGPLRSETCRADTWTSINNQCCHIVYLFGMYTCIAKNDTRTFQCQVYSNPLFFQLQVGSYNNLYTCTLVLLLSNGSVCFFKKISVFLSMRNSPKYIFFYSVLLAKLQTTKRNNTAPRTLAVVSQYCSSDLVLRTFY